MSSTTKYFFIGIILIFFISVILPGYFFPADVVNNIPSFSEGKWTRPKNSLEADPVYQFEPWRDFAKRSFFSGQFPLWNDLNGQGAPLFANMQSAVLFPLNFLYYLLPTKVAINSIYLLKLFLFGFFMYLYLRSIDIRVGIAILGAIAATFSGFMILWLYWPHTNVYLLLPLLLLLTEKLKETKKISYRWNIAIAISYFIGILGGHPETLFHIAILHMTYSVFRLWGEKKKITSLLLSILFGFILGAVQILPFLEYLRNSYTLQKRTVGVSQFYLPLQAFIMNFFPFILGGPHRQYYRPIEPQTNFQEVLGGYAGPIILLSSAFGLLVFKKKKLELFWTAVIVISWLLAYKVWPFWYLNTLPVLRTSANQRLIAFAGFGVVVLFCLVLNKVLKGEKPQVPYKIMFSNRIYGILFALNVLLFVVFSLKNPFEGTKYVQIFPFILQHIFFMVVTTILFFWMTTRFIKKKLSEKLYFIGTTIFLLSQTFLLFWNYNPVIPKSQFYPAIPVVQELKKFPKGAVLEVGNPSLPADINLRFGIPENTNYDAVEVAWYRHALDQLFPKKNQWENPDDITPDTARRLGIMYVLSDYDITLQKKTVITDVASVLHPIAKSSPYTYEISNQDGVLKQIRFRTANFNRVNTCTLFVSLRNSSTNKLLINKPISCREIRDNVFYTLTVPPTPLTKNNRYSITVTSNTNNTNALALWGDNGKPFTEFLFDTPGKKNPFTLLAKTKSTYIWKVNNSKFVEGVKKYSVLYEDPQKLVLDATSDKPTDIIIKKTFYPGWHSQINGNEVTIKNSDPFMKIPLSKGKSYIELTYRPLSFLVGTVITFLGILGLGIFLFRKERQVLGSYYKGLVIGKKIDSISFDQHVMSIVIAIVMAIACYAFLVLVVPVHFTQPWTTAINWFTVHHYPRQRDYFYYISGFLFILVFTCGAWIIWIWKKGK